MTETETKALAVWQVQGVVRALRVAGWDFVAVALWKRHEGESPAEAAFLNGAGASMFEVSTQMVPALPRLADNLRVLARELDDAHRQSGAPEIIDGHTHVVSGTTVDGRRARAAPCRRCSECSGEHHWLEYVGYVCKHCEAIAPGDVVDELMRPLEHAGGGGG